MISRLTIFIIAFTILPSLIIGDPCRYESEKGIIDLTSVGRIDGTAAYVEKIPPTEHKYKYSYNPCHPFSKGVYCINVSSCQHDGSHTTATGYHETAKWIDESGTGENLTIQYTTSERISIVFLNCSTDGTEKFEVLGEYPMLFYNFRLTHKCACWDGCNNKTKNGLNDIIDGVIFVIAILGFAFLISYGVVAYLKRQAILY